MRVFFGWGYDGARWSYADSLGDYTTGPTGLTSLLATRLGLTVPGEVSVQRIAVYRGVLARHVAAAGHSTDRPWLDRKSTRLNSSHVAISYAVFCLKKKKENTT